MLKAELERRVAWLEEALSEIASFTFPQTDHEWPKYAGRVARHIAQNALAGEPWKASAARVKRQPLRE